MTAYTVALTVELDRPIDDTTARDLAHRWAAALRLDPGLTHVDGARLTVSGTCVVDPRALYGTRLAGAAEAELGRLVRDHGDRIIAWHAVEVLSADEAAFRADLAERAAKDRIRTL